MEEKKVNKGALNVSPGVDPPGSVNDDAITRYKEKRKKLLEPSEYFEAIRKCNPTLLSQAITLVESNLPAHQELAQEIVSLSLPYSGNSIRIGITGVPGVGKSTFIESFGSYLTGQGHKLAVLAIDPSSKRTQGSILGDKTRMEALVKDQNAYIRPSPTGGSLGGVARKTRETIILCEAAGFDVIIIETVGVGQSETAVHSMVDFFLLLMLAGAGDELQGIKRGIMEMADLIAINKADGDNIENAIRAKSEFANALHLFPPAPSGWKPEAVTCSAATARGIHEIWDIVKSYRKLTIENGYFEQKRNEQSINWMFESIDEILRKAFYEDKELHEQLNTVKELVLKNQLSPYQAANNLLNNFFEKLRKN